MFYEKALVFFREGGEAALLRHTMRGTCAREKREAQLAESSCSDASLFCIRSGCRSRSVCSNPLFCYLGLYFTGNKQSLDFQS